MTDIWYTIQVLLAYGGSALVAFALLVWLLGY